MKRTRRGAPTKEVPAGVARLIARQRCLGGEPDAKGKRRPVHSEARLLRFIEKATRATASPWKVTALRQRVARQLVEHPVPKNYLDTLVAQRLEALIVNDFVDRAPFVRWFDHVL